DAGIQRQAVEQGVTRPAQQGVDEREGAHGEGFIRRRRAEVQGKALAHGGTGQQLRQHQQAGRPVACQQQGKDQIGRASCRERVEIYGTGGGTSRKRI